MEPRMKIKSIVSAMLTLSLATSGLAFAQGNSGHNDHGQSGQGQSKSGHDQGKSKSHPTQKPGNHGQHKDTAHHNGRGAGPDHTFYKGQRLPVEYRSRSYVVDDWRGHRLSAPPRGYHWVQTGGDYVLVAITTGIILQIFLSN
jgi:Ni/Co efflux regulator RcnB